MLGLAYKYLLSILSRYYVELPILFYLGVYVESDKLGKDFPIVDLEG